MVKKSQLFFAVLCMTYKVQFETCMEIKSKWKYAHGACTPQLDSHAIMIVKEQDSKEVTLQVWQVDDPSKNHLPVT